MTRDMYLHICKKLDLPAPDADADNRKYTLSALSNYRALRYAGEGGLSFVTEGTFSEEMIAAMERLSRNKEKDTEAKKAALDIEAAVNLAKLKPGTVIATNNVTTLFDKVYLVGPPIPNKKAIIKAMGFDRSDGYKMLQKLEDEVGGYLWEP